MKQAFAVPATSPLHIALNELVDAAIVEKDATHIHLADREHPSPVYHDIIKGIFSRINQLAPSGEAVSR